MTDDRRPAAADEEVLSAYLAGDLDAADAEAFEQRLAADPELRTRLDALADALVLLGDVDQHAPPDGFEQRLAQRLEEERTAPVVDLAQRREQRRRRSNVWLGVGTAAAVVALGAVMAGNMLGGAGMDSLAGGEAESAVTADAGSSESAAELHDRSAAESAGPVAPVLLDRRVAITSDQDLERRYSDLPEAQQLLGTPVAEAEKLAADFTTIVDEREVAASAPMAFGGTSGAAATAGGSADHSADADGGEDDQVDEQLEENEQAVEPEPAAPDAAKASKLRSDELSDPCLAEILDSADATLVPVRVETLRYRGGRALAYVFVTSGPGAETLDRTEVWIVRPVGCREVTFLQY